MKANIKIFFKWIALIIGAGVLVYIVFVIYVISLYTSGCGMDDGPFKAKEIQNIPLTDSIQVINIEDGQLLIDNRNDSLSPIISLKEEGAIKWSLDMDVRNTKGCLVLKKVYSF